MKIYVLFIRLYTQIVEKLISRQERSSIGVLIKYSYYKFLETLLNNLAIHYIIQAVAANNFTKIHELSSTYTLIYVSVIDFADAAFSIQITSVRYPSH